jgi:hypothetical protein
LRERLEELTTFGGPAAKALATILAPLEPLLERGEVSRSRWGRRNDRRDLVATLEGVEDTCELAATNPLLVCDDDAWCRQPD